MKFGSSRFGSNKKEETVLTPQDSNGMEQQELSNQAVEPVDLNSTGFSLIRGPESGFSLVTLKFNPITGQAKVESVNKVADSREEGEYYFRVRLGEYFSEQELKS